MVQGEEEIRQSLEILINTLPGEHVLFQDFGSDLRSYVFEAISTTMLNEIRGNLRHAITMNESRVTFTNIKVTQDPQELGKIVVDVAYEVPDSNSRYNLVFPYYLAEADR